MLSFSKFLFITIVILVSLIILIIYITDDLHIRSKRQSYNISAELTDINYYKSNQSQITFEQISKSNLFFNISGEDLLVLLHIQKTGGTTFERHLVHDLDIENACSCSNDKRRCICPKFGEKTHLGANVYETWLISRFSTGWVCGLHADWTQLSDCLHNFRRLFFMTFLRHPLHRVISEFRHVQRGATWKATKNHCKSYNTQLCYDDRPSWQNVTIEKFLSCPYNMAINRQTRMLANHHLLSCSDDDDQKNKETKDRNMLSSAKDNLKSIAFFGLCEQQKASQLLFEKTFDLKFKTDFHQSEDNKTKIMIEKLPSDVKNRILELNHLDLELYIFAVDLFVHRCKLLVGKECDTFSKNLSSTTKRDIN